MKRLTNNDFIQKAKEIHGDKYDYSLADYKNSRAKIKIICPIHGAFEQQAHSHLNGAGCPKCGNAYKYTTNDFIQKAKEIHGDKYDYSLVDYKNNETKIKIICPSHGVFEQIPSSHLLKKGCPKCGKISMRNKRALTTEEFIKKAKEIHGDKYDYSLVDYKNNHIKIKIICPVHGIFEQIPNSHLNGCGCASCKESKGEKKTKSWLEENGYILSETYFREFKFKDCKDIKPLPFDFYIPSKNLLIEYQGEQHYKLAVSYKDTYKDFLRRKHHDWLKRKYARDNNINLLVIPYWNFDSIEKILKENLEV